MAKAAWMTEELFLLIWIALLAEVHTAKILILPMQTYSSCVEMTAIAEELLTRGHNTTIFLASNFNDRQCYGNKGVRALKFKAPAGPSAPKVPEKVLDQVTDAHKDGGEVTFSTHLKIVRELTEYHCAVMISDTRMWKHFRAEKFDFILVEGSMFTYCYFAIPYKLRVPYAAYSTVFENYLLNSPFLPSLVPNPYSHETDAMSLFQRIKNTYRQIYTHIVVRRSIPGNVLTNVAPELSTRTLLQVVAKSELFLRNADLILGYAFPALPNVIDVGGVTVRPARPLPADLKAFYDSERIGVIVMSLGSTFKNLPMSLKHKLLQVLYKLNVPVVWKYMQENSNRNVKSVKWFPQNDLLGNPKTRLFISHCGSNSLFEALYHGVPIICIPIYGDQFYNAALVERWRVGLSLSLIHSPETVMFSTISYALHNVSFKANMKRASGIFKSRPQNPRQRAALWIEHVLKFGGSHLRSRALDMSSITCLGYDVFVIFAILFGCFQYCVYKAFKLGQSQWLLYQGQREKAS